MHGPRHLAPAALALGALLVLPACSTRKPIPSDPPEVRTEASVRSKKHPGPPPAEAEKPAPQPPKAPVDTSKDKVVAEMKEAGDTDAQIKEAIAKADARDAESRAGIEEHKAAPKPDTKPAPAAKPEAKPDAPKPEAKADAVKAPKAEAAKPEAAKTDASNVETAKPDAAKDAAKDATKDAADRPAMVQIASFGTEKNAEAALAWLKEKGYAEARVVRVDQGGTVYHRVQAGPFQDLATARKALEELKAAWPQAFIPAD